MWRQLFKLWHQWRPFFDCAMEAINPHELEEDGLKRNNLSDNFVQDFCDRVQQIYGNSPLGSVRPTIIHRDSEKNWLRFEFGTTHNRKLDEIGIRFASHELFTIEFLPGGSTTNAICYMDNKGLWWEVLDCSMFCSMLPEREKKDIEQIVKNIYLITDQYRSYLRFIIGHSWKIRTIGEVVGHD